MGITLLALAGAALDQLDERRFAANEEIEIAPHVVDRLEPRHPLRPRQQFVRGLRAAQHHEADERDLRAGQREPLRQKMLVALHPRGENLPDQPLVFQRAERPADIGEFQGHHRVARRLLVGGGVGGIQRQRIDVGRQRLLLGEAAEHARFGGAEDREVVLIGHGGFEYKDYALDGKSDAPEAQKDAICRPQWRIFYTLRSTIIFLISAIAFAGFSPLGQVWAQFMIVWQR